MKIYLIHDTDSDGYGAAAIAANAIERNAQEFVNIPSGHGQPLPDLSAITLDDQVYMLDICYAPEEMEKLAARCQVLTIIDHHDNKAETIKANNVTIMQQSPTLSATGMAWIFFNGKLTPPLAVQLINDRDIWVFDHPDTKPFFYGCVEIGSLEKPFSWWQELVSHGGSPELPQIMKLGLTTVGVIQHQISELFSEPTNFVLADLEGVPCVVFPCPDKYGSEHCEAVYTKWPDRIAVGVYRCPHGTGLTRLSMRSASDDLHVGKLAQALAATYGGQGGGRVRTGGAALPADVQIEGFPRIEI